jgi:hypothetical protein
MGAATYSGFLDRKAQLDGGSGFAPVWMPDFLFDFQQALVEWSVVKGRAAIFADCGLGKTPMQLVWAENVVRHTNLPVLILTPLAVAQQTVAEAVKFGIDAYRCGDGVLVGGARIAVTNYERLHHFDSAAFGGVVCDESSILKSFDGSTRQAVTDFMRKVPYRLLCTATAAPNDYIELGTSSEALGYLGHMDMLAKFFKNDQNTIKPMAHRHGGHQKLDDAAKWRFKGHAELPFWRWVCSWARACRRPSDLGFDDRKFKLPPLIEKEHVVDVKQKANGALFSLPAVGLKEQRDEARRSILERCDKVAELVNDTRKPALVWCHLNDEGDLLADVIPDAKQVSGKQSDDEKEELFLAFASGELRVLVTKPKIGAWGLNFQHNAHITFFPSHSFEQYYQGVRRSWRFGQKRPVHVDVVTTEGGLGVLKNLQRKAAAADRMFSSLVEEMNRAQSVARGRVFTKTESLPSWL